MFSGDVRGVAEVPRLESGQVCNPGLILSMPLCLINAIRKLTNHSNGVSLCTVVSHAHNQVNMMASIRQSVLVSKFVSSRFLGTISLPTASEQRPEDNSDQRQHNYNYLVFDLQAPLR